MSAQPGDARAALEAIVHYLEPCETEVADGPTTICGTHSTHWPCPIHAALPALTRAVEERDAALEEPDYRCPECGSFDTEEFNHEDDFASRKCNECSFVGEPGEDFPTSTKLVFEATTLRASLAAAEARAEEAEAWRCEESARSDDYLETLQNQATANAALTARVAALEAILREAVTDGVIERSRQAESDGTERLSVYLAVEWADRVNALFRAAAPAPSEGAK